jgi:hypothetical protein
VNFGFHPVSASHFGTRPLPTLNVSALPFSSPLQLAKKPAISSPVFANLDAASSISPLLATLTKNTLGGVPVVNFLVAQTPVCALLRQSTSKSPATMDPQAWKVVVVLPVTSHPPRRWLSLLHQSQITKSFTIRTSTKPTCNSCRIRTSKTQDLKPFRMRTYRKTPRGVPSNLQTRTPRPDVTGHGSLVTSFRFRGLPAGSAAAWRSAY